MSKERVYVIVVVDSFAGHILAKVIPDEKADIIRILLGMVLNRIPSENINFRYWPVMSEKWVQNNVGHFKNSVQK